MPRERIFVADYAGWAFVVGGLLLLIYGAGARFGESSGRNHMACDLHAAGVRHPLVEQYCPELR